MSNGRYNGFNGAEWYKQMIDRRTREAIKTKNDTFISEHAEDSNEQLLSVLRARCRELGYIPHFVEVIGARLLIERFGNWQKAVEAAGYGNSPCRGTVKLRRTKLYATERKIQEKLYRREKQAKEEIRLKKTLERKDREDNG